MNRTISTLAALLALLALGPCASAMATPLVADFESLPIAPPANFENGAHLAGSFTSGTAQFTNVFTDFGSFQTWSGWAYSRATDQSTAGYLNQYSAYAPAAGGGAGGSRQYAVGFGSSFDPPPEILLPAGYRPAEAQLTNTTYAALSMKQGDGFAKKFGGPSGNDPDYFRLSIAGWDAGGHSTGLVDFYLADFRSADHSLDKIVSQWTPVDLSPLGDAVRLTFSLASTDNDPDFGMNTPAYFAFDNLKLVAVPEPSSLALAVLAGLALAGYSSAHQRRKARHATHGGSRA